MKCKICGNKTESLFSFYCDGCNKYFEDFKLYVKQLMPYIYTTNEINYFEEVINVYRKNVNKRIFSSFYERLCYPYQLITNYTDTLAKTPEYFLFIFSV